jgi:acetate kinase
MAGKYIFVINAGSSTLKFKLYTSSGLKEVASGLVDRIGLECATVDIHLHGRNQHASCYKIKDHHQALELVINSLKKVVDTKTGDFQKNIIAIGHRVVHGGVEFVEPTLITDQVIKRLEKYNDLAPLHNPINLECIELCHKFLPTVPNWAVFDTMFFKNLPDYAYIYPLPWKYYKEEGIRKFGFHGISHHYVAERLAAKLKKPFNRLNAITCHLGSGCSIAAIKNGEAIDTTMGFGTAGGLMMATRSGDFDPDVMVYLSKKLKLNPSELEELINKESGWLGVSGVSSDMRDILAGAGYKVAGYKPTIKIDKDVRDRCHLALQMFVYRIRSYIAGYAGTMDRLDGVVLTGGIGERNKDIKKMIFKDLECLKGIKVFVIETDEEKGIASEIVGKL